MASAPSDPRPILGRVDRAGRLIAADPELAALQLEAGSTVGGTLALPQVAAIARLARKLGVPVNRSAVAAGANHDIEMWVRAVPQGDEVSLAIEGWTARPASTARLAALLGGEDTTAATVELHEWAADKDLQITSMSPSLAEKFGGTAQDFVGEPLMRLFRLEENEAGEMPLVVALATRQGFAAQPARPRQGETATLLMLNGDVVFAADGGFDGFAGRAVLADQIPPQQPQPPRVAIDQALDEALRSPLDRIIESAERIAERSDGPLRNDYASYASDISAAARHLLSVIQSMSRDPTHAHQTLDLAVIAAETVVLLEAAAEARDISIVLEATRPLPANGEERAIIQILLNLIGNAVRHSPPGGTVMLQFARSVTTASISVSDQGPGIAPADQQRIFERFERAGPEGGGTGLGLAISRRLARSMGGDITLESAPDSGAKFTLTLPTA